MADIADIDLLSDDLKRVVFERLKNFTAPITTISVLLKYSDVFSKCEFFACTQSQHPDLFRKLFKQAEQFYKL